MTIEHNLAGILIHEVVNGHLFQRYYSGYSLAEAKREFKKEIKNQNKLEVK